MVALVFGACEALGWRFLREPVSASLSRAAGVPVRLGGAFRLHVLGPPRLHVSSLFVGAAQDVDVDALLRAQDITLGWHWLDAWRAVRGGPVELQRLSASRLEAHLVRLKDGRASWALGADPAASGKPASVDRDTPLPRVAWLYVAKGTVDLIDATTATQMALTADSTGDGRGMALTAKGRLRALQVDLRAHADDTLALAQAGGGSKDVGVRVDGTVGRSRVHFEGRVGGLHAGQGLDGALRLRGASLAAVGDIVGVTLPQSPPFDLQGRLAHDGGTWRLDAKTFVVGSSELGGSFAFDSRATPPRLTGRLTGSRLLLADLGPSIGGAGGTAAPASTRAGSRRVLPDRHFDLPSLRAMDAGLTVDIAQLDLNTPALAPLSQLQASVDLQDGVLRIHALHARAPGGTVSGSMQLDGRGPAAQWRADLALSGIDVARWLRAGQRPAARPVANPSAKAAIAASSNDLTGELAASMQVTGTGQSTADIIGSIDGQVDALIRNGTVSHLLVEAAGLDVAQGLGILIRGDDALPMRCARMQLAARDGVATVTRGVIDNKDTTLLVTGELSLRQETLALTAVARPKDVSLFTLRSPIHINGPWSSPSVRLESGKLAGKAIASLVLGAITGPAALLPFIDPGSEAGRDPCTATAQR